MSTIAENVHLVRETIEQARARSAFAAPQIRLMAVTKTVDVPRMEEALAAGADMFGENKVQELLHKYEQHPEREWHLIGHLQTNKVKYIVDKVACIHSLDSLKLAAEIEKQAAKIERIIPCLLEINMAAEASKFGLPEQEAADFLRQLAAYPHILPKGLMTVAPNVPDKEQNRPVFCRMRQLLQRLQALQLPHADLTELSMGMSNDYAVAVEEGATIVRVGTAIFGARNYNINK